MIDEIINVANFLLKNGFTDKRDKGYVQYGNFNKECLILYHTKGSALHKAGEFMAQNHATRDSVKLHNPNIQRIEQALNVVGLGEVLKP